MDYSYNFTGKIERFFKNFYPVFHAPLVFDINTRSSYRKAGYVAWPKAKASGISQNKNEQEKHNNLSGHGRYFAYPKVKSTKIS